MSQNSKYVNKSILEYADELSSKNPTPGGGGTAALVGALAISLGNMVGELTVGKKKYQDVEDDIKDLMTQAISLRDEFLSLVDADAEAFEPLSKAYSLPKEQPDRDAIMEEALIRAALVPADIVRNCVKAIEVIEGFQEKGSKLAISDAGCAASLVRSAMESAALNVFINTKYMKDREFAEALNSELSELLSIYIERANRIYDRVKADLS